MIVTKAEFWRWVMTTERNVHPRSERDYTAWIDLRSHVEVARTTPGYLLQGDQSYEIFVEVR